tara:strand:+ start:992 stop:1258 length:267 start_codon:yes stop_codon:yes gene_type:complete
MTEETQKIEETVEVSGVTGEQIGESLNNLNECIRLLAKRLKDVEEHISEIPTPAKTYYKPKGYEDYMNLAENFTEIYKRLDKLDGMQN